MILLKEIQLNQGKRKNVRYIITNTLIFELTTEHRFEYRTATMLRPIIDESLVRFYRIAAIKELKKICSSHASVISIEDWPLWGLGVRTGALAMQFYVSDYSLPMYNVLRLEGHTHTRAANQSVAPRVDLEVEI